jgi:ABC-type lipoprotein release transport system permease subunit
MLRSSHGSDVLISPQNTGLPSYYSALAKLPLAATIAPVVGVAAFPDHGLRQVLLEMGTTTTFGLTVERPKLTAGRMFNPNRPDEAVAGRRLAGALHLRPGDRLALQAAPTSAGGIDFLHARHLDLKIVGVGVTRDEVVPVNALATEPTLIATPALLAQFDTSYFAFDSAYVRIRPGASPAAFEAQAQTLAQRFPETQSPLFIADERAQAAKVEHAIRPEAASLALFALLAALTGLFVIGQLLSYQLFLESTDNPTLRALGMDRTQLVVGGLAQAGIAVCSGVVLAVIVAALASPLMPIGPAHVAEPHPGFMIDWVVLGAGGLAFMVLLLARAGWSAWRSSAAPGTRVFGPVPSQRSTRALAAFTPSGMSPSAAVGLRFAFGPGRGRTTVPVWSALTGVVVAVAAVAGALTFGTNLARFVHTPRLYGQTWDVGVDVQFGQLPTTPLGTFLRGQPAVSGWTYGDHGSVTIAGRDVPTIGLAQGRGPIMWPSVIEGRAPHAPDEIMLGTKTLNAAHVRFGQTVMVTVPASAYGITFGDQPVAKPMRVVGRAVFPLFGLGSFTPTGLGEGAALLDPRPSPNGFNFVLAAFASGASGGHAAAAFREGLARSGACPADQPCDAVTTLRPVDVVNYSRIQRTPLVLSGLLSALAAATLAYLVVTSIRRRRSDLAMLKTLGFVRRQVSAAVAWEATAIAAVALLFGLPLGVAAGRWAWQVFIERLGAQATVAVPLASILLAVPAVVIAANLIAAGPGWVAGRLHPASLLRAE